MIFKDKNMGEKKNTEEEMIQNADGEVLGMFGKTDRESPHSAEKMIEEVENDISRNIEKEIKEPAEYIPLPEKNKKQSKAKYLVRKSKKIAEEANKRIEACRLLLETGLRAYEEARSALHQGGFDECVSLVKKLGYKKKNDEEAKAEIVLETKAALKPMVVKDISSGTFSGLLYALVGGIATAIGMVYLATEKLEMTLNVAKVPSEDVTQSILAWFSTIIGMNEDVAIGAGVLGIIVLLVMILIYVIRVRMKTRSNLHFAVKQFVEAELYAEQKTNCKEEMEKIDAHIQDAIGTLKAYQVLFNEQKGKLQRILYFEGEKGKAQPYYHKSLSEINDTKELISIISDLIYTPIVEDEQLSDKSILSLQNAKDKIYKIIQNF